MINITNSIEAQVVKRILGNKKTISKYLIRLNKNISIPEIAHLKKAKADYYYDLVSKYWDYEKAREIIRELFKSSDKYKKGKECINVVKVLKKEWKDLGLGDIEWPCSQGKFDELVQRINSLSDSGMIKDTRVKKAAVKYRRMKELNTIRNDYLETLIFEKNENIIPTLKHTGSVDFFVNGISYDQKVAKSPTKEFIKHYGSGWKKVALESPDKVAIFLYTYQDEGRFGSDPRLLVVYLKDEVSEEEIQEAINRANLQEPFHISFDFNHKNIGKKRYETDCFVILLGN
ncbi:MAG: hypothetical protein L0Y79_10620 [Chlorobi bacterium]|nr:hypothetical protein [Chlorobiota bacterium]MCI0716469.1 hypothetical protein [Chlorobiota bacterium]